VDDGKQGVSRVVGRGVLCEVVTHGRREEGNAVHGLLIFGHDFLLGRMSKGGPVGSSDPRDLIPPTLRTAPGKERTNKDKPFVKSRNFFLLEHLDCSERLVAPSLPAIMDIYL
jgi:hypothetical protein